MGAPIPKSKGGEQMGGDTLGQILQKVLPSTPDFTPASLRNYPSGNAPYSRDNPEKTDGGVREYMAVI